MRHRSSWLAVVSIAGAIGACDLKPAPKNQPQSKPAAAAAAAPAAAPAPPPAPATANANPNPNAPVTPGPPSTPRPQPTPTPSTDPLAQPCLDVGQRIAEILITTTTDPGLKASYEQSRTTIVRSAEQACINNKWDEALRACFLASKTQAEIGACQSRGKPPGAPPPT